MTNTYTSHQRHTIEIHWLDWTEQAFLKAKKEDKPVLLLLGNASCLWCQYIEKQMQLDDEIKALLNIYYTCIKVDSDEHPDIRNVFCKASKIITGLTELPLMVFLTSEKKPFYIKNMLPEQNIYIGDNIKKILHTVIALWDKHRHILNDAAAVQADSLSFVMQDSTGQQPGNESLHLTFKQLRAFFHYNREQKDAPNALPRPHHLLYLLRYWQRFGTSEALNIVREYLAELQKDTMYDHSGFGFYDYSNTTVQPQHPYRKSLDNQAMMLLLYLEAFQATHDETYKRVAHELIDYVQQELLSPAGAFYNGEYLQTKDTRVFTDKNGLMIMALAKAGMIFDNSRYTDMASHAASSVLNDMSSNGCLIHYRSADSMSQVPGFLDDYAFMTWGLLALYESTSESHFLERAIQITEQSIKTLWDERTGGYFFSEEKHVKLLARQKEIIDSVYPSGNAIAMYNLIMLERYTGNTIYREYAEEIIRAFSGKIAKLPLLYTSFMTVFLLRQGPLYRIVLCSRKDIRDTHPMHAALEQVYVPNKSVVFFSEEEKEPLQSWHIIRNLYAIQGKPTAYVWKNEQQLPPATSQQELLARVTEPVTA